MTVLTAPIVQFGDEPTEVLDLLSEPRYAVRITFAPGQAVWLVSHDDAVDSLPAGASVLNARLSDAPMPNINRNAGFDTGKSTITSPTYQFSDIDNVFSDLLSQKNQSGQGTFNRLIEEWEFEQGENLEYVGNTDALTLPPKFTGQIQDHSKPYNIVSVETSDINRELDEDIFDPLQWRLRSSVSESQETIPTTLAPLQIPLYQATFAHAPWYLAHPSKTGGYARIEQTGEIFWYTAFEDINGVATFTGVERGQLRTIASSVDVAAGTEAKNRPAVSEWTLIDEPGTALVEALITGETPDGRVLPDHWTAGKSDRWINSFSFAKHATSLRFMFQNIGKTKCRAFYQSELLIYMGAVLVVNGAGELVWTPRIRPTDEDSGEIVLSPQNCVTTNELVLKHVKTGIHPSVKLLFDHDAIANNYSGEYLSQVTYRDVESETHNGIGPGKRVKVFKSRGLHAGIHTASQLQKLSATFGDDYFYEKLSLTIESHINTIALGALVTVDFPQVLDDAAGHTTARPLKRTMLVVASNENRDRRTTTYSLSGSLYIQSKRQASVSLHNIEAEEYKRGKINLATLPGISINNHIASGNITLQMGRDYYYVNDASPGTGLEFGGSLNVTIQGKGRHIGLYVFGPLDIKCPIVLKGRSGHAVGRGASATRAASRGVAGYVGTSRSSGTIGVEGVYSAHLSSNQWLYRLTGGFVVNTVGHGNANSGRFARHPDPVIDANNGRLGGLPSDLGGTSGPGGPICTIYDPDRQPQVAGREDQSVPTTTVINGSDGGEGGGSLLTVSWGLSVSGNGYVDLSGDDAAPVNFHDFGSQRIYGSRGGGGGPGSWLAVIDGNHPAPLFTPANVIARYGSGAVDNATPVEIRNKYRDAGSYKSPVSATNHTVNQFRTFVRTAYTPDAENVQQRPQSVIADFFSRQYDGVVRLFIDARPSNADIGDAFITQAGIDDIDNPKPDFEILTSNGWEAFDWEAGKFRTLYQGLIAFNRTYGTTQWLTGTEFPAQFNDGDSFTNELTGDTYILRANGQHERVLRNDAAVGDERNIDFAFSLTAQTYARDGFIYYAGLTAAGAMPIQLGTVGPQSGGGGTLARPVNVAGLEFSSSTGAIQFGTVPGISRYGIFLDGARVGQVSGGYYGFTGLSGGTSYQFGVRSEDGGESSDIVYVTITTREGSGSGTSSIPSPSSLVFAAYSGVSGELSWSRANPESSVDGYRVYRDATAIGTTNGSTFYMNDLAASTTYNFRVVSYVGSSNESNAATTSGTTQAGGGSGGALSVASDGPTVQVSGASSMEGQGLYMEFRDGSNSVIHTQTVNFSSGLVSYTPPSPASYAAWTGYVTDSDSIGHSLPNQPRTYSQS